MVTISRARTKAIQGLIAGTLALSGPVPDARASSGRADLLMEALVAEVDERSLDALGRARLLRRLAISPISALRARAAEAAGALCDDDPRLGLELLRELSRDATHVVRSAAARGLARYIDHAPSLARAAVESAWATSPAAGERAALARALGDVTPDWLTDLVLAELAADPSATVRRAALQAAHAQLASAPRAYVKLAAARSADPDRRVRESARRLLRRPEASAFSAELRPSPEALRASRKRLRRALRARHGPAALA